MEIVNGSIIHADPSGLTIHVPYDNWERFARREYNSVRVEFPDERHRTIDQLRKAWALMGEMAVYISGDRGNAVDDVYTPLRIEFAQRAWERLQTQTFHLSEASVTDAREFINFLLDTCLEMDIPLSRPATEFCDDIQHYIYQCCLNRKCAVCGKKADLHHVDAVGMGRDRKEIDHVGMRALPLCREHHQEAHQHGDDVLCEKYHIEPITIDERLAEKLHLGR